MYRYAGCRWPPQRITGDAYARLMGIDHEEHYDDIVEFRVKWTPENNEYLIELVEEGKTWAEIADIFHAIEVNLRLHYARLVKNKLKKVTKNEAFKPMEKVTKNEVFKPMKYVIANLNKKPISQIAKEIGFSINSIYKQLRKMGWRSCEPHGNRYHPISRWEKVA